MCAHSCKSQQEKQERSDLPRNTSTCGLDWNRPHNRKDFHGQWLKDSSHAHAAYPCDGQAASLLSLVTGWRWTLDRQTRYLLQGDDEDAVGAT